MQDPVSQNVEGVRQLVGSGLNKVSGPISDQQEGANAEHIDEFSLERDDEELLELSRQWEGKYAAYEALIRPRQQANKTYYLGKQKSPGPYATGDGPAIAGNLIFEAEETFLPAALSKNPEPVVWADNTDEGNAISKDIKTMLQYHADTLVLRRKLTLMTRHWSIYFMGVMKHGWDVKINDIKSEVIDPQKLILDPEAAVDVYGDYEGEYIGERKTVTARKLVDLFPRHKAYIVVMVEGRMGTMVTYTEWWSDDFVFYTFKNKVLDKHKNPHYHYEQTIESTDEDGEITEVKEQGPNHFAFPKKPYTFLTVFSLGEQPHDITGLIEQNIPNQNLITRRTEQIDLNLSRANNSDIFSEDNFNQETAKQAAKAMASGHPILVPQGKSLGEAILRLQGQGVPPEFFTNLEVSKSDLRSIFGTEGISSQKPNENTTARGMILNQQFDNTRIGGGIGDALEQVADNIFNWWVQLYAVYYDVPHFAAIMGQMRAVEYITLKSSALDRRIVVSVSPDSMKPKDELTEMNQALDLWKEGALDPKTLLTILDFPDPQTTAENAVLWKVDPQSYITINFPDLAQRMAQAQAQAQQAMAQAGIQAQGAAPPGGEPAPVPGSPAPDVSAEPASASLSQVPLPT